ncbi:hypothetical protein DFH08DRAFT_978300 [Mycena albidolilacea]|uniref:Uncharacterized protein n=1 Tax=Mycena albidolilacea TaxID=1033008 RepID=A0AAD6YZ37_9AGAR|nr:hypothetical protein DFH08DRAFT_978300 [Mycena albidolilacea]
MPRGRRSPLAAEKLEYLESHLAEFQEAQPNLKKFWAKVEKGYFAKWKVEVELGLPILDTEGVSIEDSGVSEEHQTAIGAAQQKVSKSIHNWYNNRSQKEKKHLNGTASTSGTSDALKEVIAALAGKKRGRKSQRIEIWQQRNTDIMKEALRQSDFDCAMGVSDEEETTEERQERIRGGKREQMSIFRRVRQDQFAQASVEEKAAVEELYMTQVPKPGIKMGKAETPEEFQLGLNNLGAILKGVHGAITDLTGWVGGTVLTGPMPNRNGQIATQSYCHGVTPTGQSLDEALTGWEPNVIKPLQQFGKAVFDHQTRRERTLTVQDAEDTTLSQAPTPTLTARKPCKRAKKKVTATPIIASAITPAPIVSTPEPAAAAVSADVPLLQLTDDALQTLADKSLYRIDSLANHGLQDLEGGLDPGDDYSWNSSYGDLSWPLQLPSQNEEWPEPQAVFPDLRPLTADSPSRAGLSSFVKDFVFDRSDTRPSYTAVATPTTPLAATPPANPRPSQEAEATHAVPPMPAVVGGLHDSLPPQAAAVVPAIPAMAILSLAAFSRPAPHAVPRLGPASRPLPQPLFRGADRAGSTPAMPMTPLYPKPLHVAEATCTTPGDAAGTTPTTPTTPLPLSLGAGGALSPSVTPSSPCPPSPPSPNLFVGGALSHPATPSFLRPPTSSLTPPNPLPASLRATPAGVRQGSAVTTSSPLGLSVQTAAPHASGTAASPMATLNVSMTTLTPDDFPESRPMSNAPKGLPSTRGGRDGRGGGRGARGGRGRRGGRGGGGRGQHTGNGEGEMMAHEEEEGPDALGVGNPASANSQTVAPIPRARMLEIRAFEKERDAAAAREARRRDHGIFAFPPPPAGHESLHAEPAALGARGPPTEPEVLGPRARRHVKNYEPPKKRTMVEIREGAAAKRDAIGQKRKRGAENDAPVAKKKRKSS